MKPGNFGSVLEAFAASRRHLPFAWGSNDCATWPADLYVAAGMGDFLAGLRNYTTALGAAAVLQAAGYADLKALADDRLAPVLDDDNDPNFAFAQTGDVALLENAGHTGIYAYTFAVFRADGRLMGPGEHAMEVRPRFHPSLSPLIAAYRWG